MTNFLAGQRLTDDRMNFLEDPASDLDATDETGVTSTTYTDGATTVGESFIAPSSGRVLVLWHARIENNSATGFCHVSASVRTGSTLGSGTEVSAPADGQAISFNEGAGSASRGSAAMYKVVTGLTAGDTYNAVVEHRVTSNNSDIFDRSIAVMSLP